MPDKRLAGNFFEDFTLGARFVHPGGRTLTEGDRSLYIALTNDRRALYCDHEYAHAAGYAGTPLPELLVFHIVFGKTVPEISKNAIANLGYADVRFLRPVYPGDTLQVQTEVIGLKENSNGTSGVVYVLTRGLNQNGNEVVRFYRWVMLRKRDAAPGALAPSVPTLPVAAQVNDIVISATESAGPVQIDASAMGPHFLEDYAPGDRIEHPDGMTLTETEHAMATRLYHNNAKVHFDGHAMAQTAAAKRLVYGGHVISVAHALSFDGLENAFRILAWNGGTHANPTYAGDTLYALTDVLDVDPGPESRAWGTLRLRLIAVKNHNPAEQALDIRKHDPAKERDVYDPRVVLDLDYVAAVWKRAAFDPVGAETVPNVL